MYLFISSVANHVSTSKSPDRNITISHTFRGGRPHDGWAAVTDADHLRSVRIVHLSEPSRIGGRRKTPGPPLGGGPKAGHVSGWWLSGLWLVKVVSELEVYHGSSISCPKTLTLYIICGTWDVIPISIRSQEVTFNS